jgi:flagellar assembly protein FliH
VVLGPKSMSNLITESTSEVENWNLPVIGGKVRDKPPSVNELEELRKKAYQKGFTEGKSAGLKAGQGEIQKQVAHLQQVLQNMAAPLADYDEQLSQEVAELSIAIASQIIRRELRQEPGQIIAIAREALAQLPSSAQKIKITLHPEDAALLREFLPEGEGHEYQMVESGTIKRGGCMVEASNSRVDATVEKQINSVVAALFGEERQRELDELAQSEPASGTESEPS